MPSCLTAPVLDERFPLPGAAPVAPLEVTEGDRESLLTALGRVPDPRDPRGVRYPIVAMVTVVVCAMLAGARSYAAIGQVVCAWIRACLTRVNAAARARSPDRRPVRRVLAVDGKAMRATLRGPGPMHLLCALDHARGVVVAQVSVDVKTNEIPLFATLLDQVPDLQGTLITGDALHAQVRHLDYLHARGAHLLVCVKGNQPTLRSRLWALPWTDVPVGHTQTGTSVHGRARSLLRRVGWLPLTQTSRWAPR